MFRRGRIHVVRTGYGWEGWDRTCCGRLRALPARACAAPRHCQLAAARTLAWQRLPILGTRNPRRRTFPVPTIFWLVPAKVTSTPGLYPQITAPPGTSSTRPGSTASSSPAARCSSASTTTSPSVRPRRSAGSRGSRWTSGCAPAPSRPGGRWGGGGRGRGRGGGHARWSRGDTRHGSRQPKRLPACPLAHPPACPPARLPACPPAHTHPPSHPPPQPPTTQSPTNPATHSITPPPTRPQGGREV